MNLVISLLTHRFILNPVRPSIIACPANVPVTDEEIPAESKASAKINAENFPKSGIKFYMPDQALQLLQPDKKRRQP